MFIFFCAFLRVNDIAIVRTGFNSSQTTENVVDSIKIEDFHSNLNNFRDNKKWIIFADTDTAISTNYILSILSEYSQKQTVVGRFGCIPNAVVSNKRKTKTCMPYPIIKSGFAVTSDLLKNLEFIDETKSELDFGVLLQNTDFVDDFRFHYFDANHKTRGEKFAATFFPLHSAKLDKEFLHAAGIPVDVMLTNKAKGRLKLGIGFNFNKESIEEQRNINVDIQCGNVSFIQAPPQVFTRNAEIKINCF